VAALATLGPEGGNHDWVAQRYLAAIDATGIAVVLCRDFDEAFERLFDRNVAFVLQAAVHPAAQSSVARHRGRAHLIDAFLSPSQPMALLKQKNVGAPKSLGLQPATRDYLDLTRFDRLIEEPTTTAVAEGLLSGRYEAGITLTRFLEAHPDDLALDTSIGEVVDPWLVFGREPAFEGMNLWRDSPAARILRRAAAF